jgi:hypothetical protein
MSTEVARVLREARALIDKPEKWCQEVDALTADGDECDARRPEAKCRCISGAIAAVSDPKSSAPTDAAWSLLWNAVDGNPVDWNDAKGRTHADILAAMDRAIASAESTPTPMTEGE